MRRIAANYIFPINQKPILNGYIELTDEGEITAIGKLEKETESTEFYNGIICPGFIDTHQDSLSLEHILSRNTVASFEIGGKPEVVLIDNIDFKEMKLTKESTIKRLL